jgi:hypothetical protein
VLLGELPLLVGSMRARGLVVDVSRNSGFTLPSTFLDDEIESTQELDYSKLGLTGYVYFVGSGPVTSSLFFAVLI